MKRIFDIDKGHYVTIVNEADGDTSFNASEAPQNQEGKTPDQQQDASTGVQQNKNVEDNQDIQRLEAQKNAEQKRFDDQMNSWNQTFDRQMQTLRDTLTAAQTAAASAETQTAYDKVQTNRDVLTVKKQIADLDLKNVEERCRMQLAHARELNKIENQKLDVLKKMTNEGMMRLPEKYRKVLNESNIAQAKIYVNNLVGSEDRHILTGMVDFNHAFADSQLVYGRDKNGYYVLCIDQEDFNRLYQTMQEAGYHRDDVLATVMPQLLDRRNFVAPGAAPVQQV